MSVTMKLMLVCSIALSAESAAPQSSLAVETAVKVERVPVVVVPVRIQQAQSQSLDMTTMQAVRGGGFFKKLWKVVTKVLQVVAQAVVAFLVWAFEHPEVFDPPCDPGITECPYEITDTYENTVDVVNYYDDASAFSDGRVSSRSESSSGFVFTGRTVGGGGSDGGCDPSNGCYAY